MHESDTHSDSKGALKAKWQEHDVWYVVDRVQESHWRQPLHVIQQVVASCKEQVKPTEGREKLLGVAKEKMRAMEDGGAKSRDAGKPG